MASLTMHGRARVCLSQVRRPCSLNVARLDVNHADQPLFAYEHFFDMQQQAPFCKSTWYLLKILCIEILILKRLDAGNDLRAALDDVLAGRPVQRPVKPSIGCNIKWHP